MKKNEIKTPTNSNWNHNHGVISQIEKPDYGILHNDNQIMSHIEEKLTQTNRKTWEEGIQEYLWSIKAEDLWTYNYSQVQANEIESPAPIIIMHEFFKKNALIITKDNNSNVTPTIIKDFHSWEVFAKSHNSKWFSSRNFDTNINLYSIPKHKLNFENTTTP